MPLQQMIFRDARWITPKGAQSSIGGNRAAMFRLEFVLPEPLPSGVALKLCATAHTRYKLFVNEKQTSVGPRKGNVQQHFYERVELSDGLVPGRNVITAQVVAYAPLTDPENMGYSPISVLTLALEPMLLIEGGAYAGDALLFDITTGRAAWRACVNEGIEWIRDPQTHYIGALERCIAEKLPQQDGAWPPAAVRWNPNMNDYGEMPPLMLAERTIPAMYEQEHAFIRQMPCADSVALLGFDRAVATEIPAGSRCAVELDAGELTTGYMHVHLHGGKGARLRVRYGECYRPMENGKRVKRVRDEPCEGGLDDAFDELLPCGGRLEFASFWFRTFRFVRIEIETAQEPLRLEAPYYVRTGYPLEVKASVRSGAGWVEKLYDVSLRTLRCCMHETYEDCPFYEQLQYTSDTKLQMDFTYAVSGDARLARQVIEDFHRSLLPDGMLQSRTPSQHRQVIPQFSLYFIHMLDALYRQDGDAKFVARYRPTVDAVLDAFDRHRDADGMVRDLGYWDFGDWEPRWERGNPTAVSYGPSTIHNLVYAWTLQVAAGLLSETGRASVADEYAQRAGEIMAVVQARCFDAEAGLYWEGPDYHAYSQHAQVFAVLCGLLKGESASRALEAVLQREDAAKCSYPQQFYLLRALEQCGRYELSEAIWKDFADLLPLNITTLPETPVAPRSDCHAWSALALYDMPRVWLGVRPLVPAWKGIEIAPTFLPSLNDMAGEVPTPHGPVSVAWKRDGEIIRFSAKAPKGVSLVVRLPGRNAVEFPDGGVVELQG